MTYQLTSYQKTGKGTVTSTGSTTLTCSLSDGFRNVAVGATIISDGNTRTVSSKTSESVVVLNSATTIAAKGWVYTNPVLTLSNIYFVKHIKEERGSKLSPALQDSNLTLATITSGATRSITISGFINADTVASRELIIAIVEGLNDGSQGISTAYIYTEESPARNMYVFVDSASWELNRDNAGIIDIMLTMTECRNRGA